MRHVLYRRKPESHINDADLDHHFAPLKEADYRDTFEATRVWLECAERRRQARQELPGRWGLHYARHHRARLALAGFLIACTIAACTIPVEQEETLGYTLSGTFRPDDSAQTVMDGIRSLDWVMKVDWGMIRKEAAEGSRPSPPEWLTFVVLLPDVSEAEAKGRKQELEALAGVASVEALPLTVKVKRRLYQAAIPPALRPPVWKASMRLSTPMSAAEVERAIERHFDQLQAHKIDVSVLPAEDGGQELAISSRSWRSLDAEGLQHLERLQHEVKPFLEEDAAIGFILSGRFLPVEADPVMRQIRKLDRFNYIAFGTIKDGETVQWLTFEIRCPGASREQASAWAEELKAIDGISEVDVRPIGQ